MEEFLTYLLKSTALLSLFYLVYGLLLKKDTDFVANRRFFFGGIVAAAILPAITFTRKIWVEPVSNYTATGITETSVNEASPIFNIWEFAGWIYMIVSLILLLRLSFQLISVVKLISAHPIQKNQDYYFIETSKDYTPFSFFKYIIYNPEAHSEKELDLILCHEKVHARQRHSIDILFANLTTALLWFNPLSWFYKKSIEQNLEFIADKETVAATGEKTAYQHTLLKITARSFPPPLTNQFYQSLIKKRILMLNKNQKSNQQPWKMMLLFPLILAFMLSFNVETEARILKSSPEISKSRDSFKITVYNTASDQDLREFSELAKENNILLEFTNVKRNKEGKISKINTTFQDLDSNKKGTLGLSKSEGIAALVFSKDSDGNISMFPATKSIETTILPETSEKNKNKLTKRSQKSQEIPRDPLYILNGEKSKKEIIELIDPNLIKSVNVLKDESAVSLYGEDAKDGAVIITTKVLNEEKKMGSNSIGIQKLSKTDYQIMTNNNFNSSDSEATEKAKIFTDEQAETSPLVIIDGEKNTAEFMKNELQPEDIEKINVLKGAGAIKKYGKGAEDGVIEITTKQDQIN